MIEVAEGNGASSISATSESSEVLGSRDIEVFVDDEVDVSPDFFRGMWDAGAESPSGMEFPPPLPKMHEAELRGAWLPSGPAPDMLSMCLCPITHEVMREPVIAADGMTYDREAIMKWFLMCDERGSGPVSPVTNQPLSTDYIVPNHTSRCLLYALQDMANTRFQAEDRSDAGTQTAWSPQRGSRSLFQHSGRSDVGSCNGVVSEFASPSVHSAAGGKATVSAGPPSGR